MTVSAINQRPNEKGFLRYIKTADRRLLMLAELHYHNRNFDFQKRKPKNVMKLARASLINLINQVCWIKHIHKFTAKMTNEMKFLLKI